MASLQTSSVDGVYPLQNRLEKAYSTTTRSSFLPGGSAINDFGSTTGKPMESSPLSHAAAQHSGRFNEEWDASQRGSSIIDGPAIQRTNSTNSQGDTLIPSRGGTLKKKASLRRGNSLKRSNSRRSSRAGSVRSLALEPDGDEIHSAFWSPVPTTANPTEVLATRFSVWRKVLKDLIAYFREIQSSYDQKSKNLLKASNVINNIIEPPIFLSSGGINDALKILREFHKQSIMEANKAKAIENDVILSLTGLRSDLQQKIKEIKNLSGDFKNSVDKEMDSTRRVVASLAEALGQASVDPAQMTGKQDPYLLRLAADRQLERQIDEENYLHQAYLNLESSGRELEAIVVGEIQKSYNAYAGILKRDADEAYNAVESLRTGPIAMPKDQEWNSFIEKDEHFVDPRIPVRQAQNIYYPGRDHELATEVRAGLLERKSKYLKSYTPGWYVLSPTHLHEFKSADKAQAPIMSLYLPEQKLGSHSIEGGSSNKFILKGRQTGSLRRGHSWVFRAESHDTMMAWYEDIKSLTEKSPQERNAFVRQHARSISQSSQKAGSISSDGVVDEEDEEPFAAATSAVVAQGPKQDVLTKRPQPGGRFPSDLQVNAQRGLHAPLSPSSGSSFGDTDTKDHDVIAAAADLPGSGIGEHYEREPSYKAGFPGIAGASSVYRTHASHLNRYADEDGMNPYTGTLIHKQNPLSKSTVVGHIEHTEQYRDRRAETAPEVANQYNPAREFELTPRESNAIATRATKMIEQIAAQESPCISAPDADISFSGTSQGYIATNSTKGSQSIHETPKDITLYPIAEPIISGQTELIHVKSQGETLCEPRNTVHAVAVEEPQIIKTSKDHRTSLADILRAGQRHSTSSSVSQLHIPGEFPGDDGSGL